MPYKVYFSDKIKEVPGYENIYKNIEMRHDCSELILGTKFFLEGKGNVYTKLNDLELEELPFLLRDVVKVVKGSEYISKKAERTLGRYEFGATYASLQEEDGIHYRINILSNNIAQAILMCEMIRTGEIIPKQSWENPQNKQD